MQEKKRTGGRMENNRPNSVCVARKIKAWEQFTRQYSERDYENELYMGLNAFPDACTWEYEISPDAQYVLMAHNSEPYESVYIVLFDEQALSFSWDTIPPRLPTPCETVLLQTTPPVRVGWRSGSTNVCFLARNNREGLREVYEHRVGFHLAHLASCLPYHAAAQGGWASIVSDYVGTLMHANVVPWETRGCAACRFRFPHDVVKQAVKS